MDSLPTKKMTMVDALDALIAALFMQMAAGSSKDVIMNRIAGNG
jgi:predicted RNase H-like nuclease